MDGIEIEVHDEADSTKGESLYDRSWIPVLARHPTDGVIGSLYVQPEHKSDGVFVWAVSVSATYRRRGVASAVMRTAEDMARMRGRTHVRLYCYANNLAGVALYRSLGYRAIDDECGRLTMEKMVSDEITQEG